MESYSNRTDVLIRRTGDTRREHAQRKGHVRAQPKVAVGNPERAPLADTNPASALMFRLPASTTVRKYMSVVEATLWYSIVIA